MKKLFKIFAVVLVGAAAINLAACKTDKPGGEEEQEEKLTVEPGTLTFASDDAEPQTVEVKSTSPWTAEANDEWITISPASGETDGTFTVTVALGTEARSGSITVGSGDLSETVTVNQTSPEFISVTGVELDESTLTMRIDDEVQLIATVYPDDATNSALEWDSSDDAVATVDENGLVRAVSPGPATITVSAVDGNHSAACEVTVLAPDVYIVGNETENYVTRAWFMMNGVKEMLSESRSEGLFVTVVGDDVYVAGREETSPGSFVQVATIWKNSVAQKLGSLNSFARYILVSGDDVYVCGMENDADYVSHATLWKNNQAQVLSANHSDAKAIAIIGSDVYVVGEELGSDNKPYAVIWKNGTATKLSDNQSSATSAYVYGDDLYVGWFESIVGPMRTLDYARLWKDGTSRNISESPSRPNGLYIDGSDVYVAGMTYIDSDANGIATLWTNDQALPLSTTISTATAITFSKDDKYVVGMNSDSSSKKQATLWKNDIPEILNENESIANSIFVK